MRKSVFVTFLLASVFGLAANSLAKDSTILFRYKQRLVYDVGGTHGPGAGDEGPENPGIPGDGSGEDEPNGLRAVNPDGTDADPSEYRNVTVSPESNIDYDASGSFCLESLVEGFSGEPTVSVSVAGGASEGLVSSLEEGFFLLHFADFVPDQPEDRWYISRCGTALYNDGGVKEITYTWHDPDGRTLTMPTTLHVNPQPRPPLSVDLSGWETNIDLTDSANWTDRALNIHLKGGIAPYTITDVQASPYFQAQGSWLNGLASMLNLTAGDSDYADGVYFGLAAGTDDPQIQLTSIETADDYARCVFEHDCELRTEQCAVSSFDAHQEYVAFTVKDSIGAAVSVPMSVITTGSNVQCSNAGYPHHWVWGMPTPPYEYSIDVNTVSPNRLGSTMFTGFSRTPIE